MLGQLNRKPGHLEINKNLADNPGDETSGNSIVTRDRFPLFFTSGQKVVITLVLDCGARGNNERV